MNEFEKALLKELKKLRKQVKRMQRDLEATGDCFVEQAEYYKNKNKEGLR